MLREPLSRITMSSSHVMLGKTLVPRHHRSITPTIGSKRDFDNPLHTYNDINDRNRIESHDNGADRYSRRDNEQSADNRFKSSESNLSSITLDYPSNSSVSLPVPALDFVKLPANAKHSFLSSQFSSKHDSKIRVVIRIRPLNHQEIKRGYRCVIEPVPSQSVETGAVEYNQLRICDPVSIEMLNKGDNSSSSLLDSSFWFKHYAFDSCLWSNPDGYRRVSDYRPLSSQITTSLQSADESGRLIADVPVANQQSVFDDVGKPILDWILQGYNCSVVRVSNLNIDILVYRIVYALH